MELIARIGGKSVAYPASATFVIEQRHGNRKYALTAHKDSIHKALPKFHRIAQKPNTTTRLRFAFDGKLKTMATEKA